MAAEKADPGISLLRWCLHVGERELARKSESPSTVRGEMPGQSSVVTPPTILEHADEDAARELWRDVIFQREREADPLARRPDRHVRVTGDQRPVGVDDKRLSASLDLPPIHARGSHGDVDAAAAQQVTGRRGFLRDSN
jgi:hypothetical protein